MSFKRELPYYIAATAPLIDGYASTGAAMEMIRSGYGEDGNNEAVCKSDFNYILIDDYRDFAKRIQVLL